MGFAVATKYLDRTVQDFYTRSVIAGKSRTDFTWDGVSKVVIPTILTQPLNDYLPDANGNRFGIPTNVEDSIQEIPVERLKSFSMVIEKYYNSRFKMLKRAGQVLALQNREQVVPYIDKYTLRKWCYGAGVKVVDGEITKSNAVEKLFDANASFLDNSISFEGAYLYASSRLYNFVRLSPEFLSVRTLAEKILPKGVVGEVADFQIVKTPNRYFPANYNFLVAHKNAVVAPVKYDDTFIHPNAQGYNGHVIEGAIHFDAAVISRINKAVYASLVKEEVVNESLELSSAAETVTIGTPATITATTTEGTTQEVIAESSAPNIATASVSSGTITITGVKPGECYITVECGNKTVKCTVTVIPASSTNANKAADKGKDKADKGKDKE